MSMGSIIWLGSVVLLLLISAVSGQEGASAVESLFNALDSDARLDVLGDAMRDASAVIAPQLQVFPMTVVAPTDDAFQLAFEQKRLRCRDHLPCLSIDEYFSPLLLERNILRHIFPRSVDLEDMNLPVNLSSVNGFSVKMVPDITFGVRLGGAAPVIDDREISFGFGKVIVVDDILPDYSRLNATDVAVAERIVDLGPFSEADRVTLSEAIQDIVNNFRRIRAQDSKKRQEDTVPFLFMPSSIAQDFSPCSNSSQKQRTEHRRGGDTSSFENSEIVWNIPVDVERPTNPEDIAFMSILELASLLRQGRIKSTELTQLFLSRMKKLDPYLELVVTYTEELALKQARKADEEMQMGIDRGPLHGIPYGLKDIIAVPEYPTTWGSKHLRNQTFADAAWVFQQLSKAGAVLIAKLSTGAFAFGDVWFGGRTKNPWNIMKSSCGSSGGSGAATAAGLVPFALGTETWGSISCPASRVGVTAIRSTYGFVGRSGIMSLAWSLDKVGTFCRVATDCALVMDSLRGTDPDDASSARAPFTFPESNELRRLRIGYTSYTDPQVINIFRQMGMQMIYYEIISDLPTRAMLSVIVRSEASANFEQQQRMGDGDSYVDISHVLPKLLRGGQFIPAAEYIRANQVRRRVMEKGEKLFEEVDMMLIPSVGNGNQGAFGNLIGIPEVIFPTGHEDIKGAENSNRKRPTTQALIGKAFSDGQLLAVVAEYQKMTDHHLKRPPVNNVEQEALDFCLPNSRSCPLGGTIG